MPSLDTYRKQAKQLVRWHREGNYSLGGKVRLLHRYRDLTDIEVLEMPLPLTLAQEVVAVEAGFQTWADLKGAAAVDAPTTAMRDHQALAAAIPVLFVRDVSTAAAFYETQLGFRIDFLHGKPPFYGSVSRDDACLHLRFVHAPNFTELESRERSLILATIEAGDVKALFAEFEVRSVVFPQRLKQQPWGGLDFTVRDLDGNVISFVQYRRPTRPVSGVHE